MIDLSVKADLKAATRYLYDYERRVIPRATNRSINTTARNVQTAINRHIAKETGLKAGEVKAATSITKSTFSTLRAIVKGRRRPYNLFRFLQPRNRSFLPGAFANQRGVKANPWRKSRIFKGTFIIRGSGHGRPIVVKRTGRNRYPLKAVYGPSIHSEFNRPAARALMNSTARTRFRINFERDLKYYISRLRT